MFIYLQINDFKTFITAHSSQLVHFEAERNFLQTYQACAGGQGLKGNQW